MVKSPRTSAVNSKTFMVMGERGALGFLGNINRIDTLGNRDLILGEYLIWVMKHDLFNALTFDQTQAQFWSEQDFIKGRTRSRQGAANGFDNPDFTFVNPEYLEGSDFSFPSQNVSLFPKP